MTDRPAAPAARTSRAATSPGTAADPRSLLVLADRVYPSFDGGATGGADALLVHAGRVVAAGSAKDVAGLHAGAAVLDLRGHTVTPGFADAHIHLIEWALSRRQPDLTGSATPEEAVALLSGLAGAGEWLVGHGWSGNRWGRLPDRHLIDRVVGAVPVVLRSQDMHALWVSTKALELCAIGRDTPNPEGGVIVRDAAGEPTGVLLETAMALVVNRMPRASDRAIADMVLDGQRALHALGVTAVHSFPSVHAQEPLDLRVLELLAAGGELRLRVLQQLPERLLEAAISLGLRSGAGGDWIRIGGVKLFLDGSLGSRTAWLHEPYAGSEDVGIALYEPDTFRAVVRRAAEAGLSSTVHAIGDAAVDLALEVFSDPALVRAALPHRIEHVQLCSPARFGAAGSAGIVQSMQPAHLMTDWRPADRLWGAERCRGAYAFRSLGSSGGVLAFGSDGPVADPDPRLGLYAATMRQDAEGEPCGGWFPEERLTTMEALWCYTGGAAAAAGQTGQQGALTPGAWADFVAWDRDPAQLTGRDLLRLECRATVVGGELVWTADA
jgi:predicted amidohydrolase YtcJ